MRNVYEHFGYWYDWLQENGSPSLKGKTISQLIEYQHELNVKSAQSMKIVNRREILGEIVRFVYSKTNGDALRGRYAKKLLYDVTSVFSVALEENGGFPAVKKTDLNKIKGQPNVRKTLSFDKVRRIIKSGSQVYRAAFSVMLASGCGESEVIQFSDNGIDELRRILRKPEHLEPDIIRIELKARKSNSDSYCTMIGGSALTELQAYLELRDEMEASHEGEFPDSVFVNQWRKPLTVKNLREYWLDQLKAQGEYVTKHGENKSRSGLNLHLLRSVFRTRWEKSGASTVVAEGFMGHTVDALGYNRIMNDREWTLQQYLTAVRWLDVNQPDPDEAYREVQKIRAEYEELKKEVMTRREIDPVMEKLVRNPKFLELIKELAKEEA